MVGIVVLPSCSLRDQILRSLCPGSSSNVDCECDEDSRKPNVSFSKVANGWATGARFLSRAVIFFSDMSITAILCRG